jgi:hypothetical protein
MRALGYKWDLWDDVYSAQINDRSYVSVWKFDNIYQCKVFINYPIANTRVGICLSPKDTQLSAMDSGIVYAKEFAIAKLITVEETFYNCFKYWDSIFKTRLDVIDHLFFVIGNGYEWLDGALINTSPEDYLSSKEDERLLSLLETLGQKKDKTRPLPDDGLSVSFYPVSKYCSNICKIPDDIKPDWLVLCKEAAVILRDRSGGIYKNDKAVIQQENNRSIGAEIVKELDKRFPNKIFSSSDFQNRFDDLNKKIKYV